MPVIVLTGDISAHAKHEIRARDCVQMLKPVAPEALTQLIRRLIPSDPSSGWPNTLQPTAENAGPPKIYVVESDPSLLKSFGLIFQRAGHSVQRYASCEAFLDTFQPVGEGCLVIDAHLPGMSGLELLQRLKDAGIVLPSVVVTSDGDVATAVRAMQAGAVDVLELPINDSDLLESVEHALALSRVSSKEVSDRQGAANHMLTLTLREQQVMTLILEGHASKNIAATLGISQRTVENHRASIMHKTGARSLPALARLAVAGEWREERSGKAG